MFVTVAKAASPFVGASTRLVVARVAFSLRLTLHQGDLVRSAGAALESQGRWLGLLVVFLMFFCGMVHFCKYFASLFRWALCGGLALLSCDLKPQAAHAFLRTFRSGLSLSLLGLLWRSELHIFAWPQAVGVDGVCKNDISLLFTQGGSCLFFRFEMFWLFSLAALSS